MSALTLFAGSGSATLPLDLVTGEITPTPTPSYASEGYCKGSVVPLLRDICHL